jgi:hypothetical protein
LSLQNQSTLQKTDAKALQIQVEVVQIIQSSTSQTGEPKFELVLKVTEGQAALAKLLGLKADQAQLIKIPSNVDPALGSQLSIDIKAGQWQVTQVNAPTQNWIKALIPQLAQIQNTPVELVSQLKALLPILEHFIQQTKQPPLPEQPKFAKQLVSQLQTAQVLVRQIQQWLHIPVTGNTQSASIEKPPSAPQLREWIAPLKQSLENLLLTQQNTQAPKLIQQLPQSQLLQLKQSLETLQAQVSPNGKTETQQPQSNSSVQTTQAAPATKAQIQQALTSLTKASSENWLTSQGKAFEPMTRAQLTQLIKESTPTPSKIQMDKIPLWQSFQMMPMQIPKINIDKTSTDQLIKQLLTQLDQVVARNQLHQLSQVEGQQVQHTRISLDLPFVFLGEAYLCPILIEEETADVDEKSEEKSWHIQLAFDFEPLGWQVVDLSLQISSTGRKLSTDIYAQKQSTLDLWQTHQPTLCEQIEKHGFQMTQVSLSLDKPEPKIPSKNTEDQMINLKI